jgi:hypothetical protein
MKSTLLSFLFIFSIFCHGQSYHNLILIQGNNPSQWVSETKAKKYPEAIINSKKKEGYYVSNLNYKKGYWLLVMNKGSRNQSIHISPPKGLVGQKLKDGYIIQDFCFFPEGNKIKRLYVLTKVKNVKVRSLYFFGQPWNVPSSEDYNFSILADKYSDKGYWIYGAKSFKSSETEEIGVYAYPKPDGGINQIWAYRIDKPMDFVTNKKKQGYHLSVLTYDRIRKSWFIVMHKQTIHTNRIVYSYKSGDIKLLRKKLKNNYTIINVN